MRCGQLRRDASGLDAAVSCGRGSEIGRLRSANAESWKEVVQAEIVDRQCGVHANGECAVHESLLLRARMLRRCGGLKLAPLSRHRCESSAMVMCAVNECVTRCALFPLSSTAAVAVLAVNP